MIAKLCPSCKRNNPSEAPICQYCGTRFPDEITDLTISKKPPQLEFLAKPKFEINDTDLVMFVVVGEEKPIPLNFPEGSMTVGRFAPGNTSPDIDLSDYGAGMLGVSRLHALFTRSEQGFFVEDLGSTNGTFLNNQELHPHTPYFVGNGDFLSLGQLILTVHYAAVSATKLST